MLYFAQAMSFKDPLSYLCLAGFVLTPWSLRKEVAGLNNFFTKNVKTLRENSIVSGKMSEQFTVTVTFDSRSFAVLWWNSPFTGFVLYLNMTHEVAMPPDQYCFCVVANTIFFVSTFCSTYFIISMTFDRFYSIIKPHKAASFNTVKRAKITIVCVVIFSFLFNIPHVFLTSNQQRQCVPFGKATGLTGQFYYWLNVGHSNFS